MIFFCFVWQVSFCSALFVALSFVQALRKKQLIAAGKLGKFGKVLETTPKEVLQELQLYVLEMTHTII